MITTTATAGKIADACEARRQKQHHETLNGCVSFEEFQDRLNKEISDHYAKV